MRWPSITVGIANFLGSRVWLNIFDEDNIQPAPPERLTISYRHASAEAFDLWNTYAAEMAA